MVKTANAVNLRIFFAMYSTTENNRYMEWKSAEEMNETSLNWISRLKFIKDEHKFFEALLKEYTLPVVQSNQLGKVTGLVALLMDSEKQQEELLRKVNKHRNGLEVMIDGLDQTTEENRYRDEYQSGKGNSSLWTGIPCD